MTDITRRDLLCQASMLAPLLATGGAAFAADANKPSVTVLENIGKQHGIVTSMLLTYLHIANQLGSKAEIDFQTVGELGQLNRDFIESFHEDVAEEKYILQILDKSHVMADDVVALRAQHVVSKQLTDLILAACKDKSSASLGTNVGKFVGMYVAHAAWEDAIVFPAVLPLVSTKEYADSGAKLLAEEEKLFGKGGLDNVMSKLSAIQHKLGIGNLASFTAKV
jgi:hypothetical protein